MNIDPKMERWIMASVAKHFDALKGDYYLHIDGQERQYDDQPQWVELKLLGPTPIRYSANEIKYTITVILFCNSVMDIQDQYRLKRLTGFFLPTLDKSINVYKYGDGDDFIGCFVLRSDLDRPIDRIDYGQVDASNKVEQTSLEAHYQMEQP